MRKIYTLCLVYEPPRILLGFKKIGLGAGQWNAFGGKLEEGEMILEAGKRELFEEAGIRATQWEKRGVLEFSFEGKPDILEMHVFKASGITGTPVESNEMRPRWFNHKKIPLTKMWPADVFWIPLFLTGKQFEGKFLYDNEGSRVITHELREI